MTKIAKGTCRICDKQVFERGLCQAHYTRQFRYGDPLGGGTGKGELRRFFEEASIYDGSECLIWPYNRNTAGYGYLKIGKRSSYAHRLICERVNGQPPDDKPFALHSCGNGHLGCVTPNHLRWGSAKDNSDDSRTHGTIACGVNNGACRITDEVVTLIRKRAGSATQRELSTIFGISQQHVSRIIRGTLRKAG